MTTDRELLEMALEALEEVRDAKILALELKPSYHNIISSLHARLAQPDLAKVGEVGVWGEPVIDKSAAKRIAIQLGWEPKREWHGLTDDEIDEIIGYVDPHCQEEQFARAIEAKLKEKNQ